MIKKTEKIYPLEKGKTLFALLLENLYNNTCSLDVWFKVNEMEFDKYYNEFNHLLSIEEENKILDKYLKDYRPVQYLHHTKILTDEMFDYENLLNNFNKKDLCMSNKIPNFAISTLKTIDKKL